LKTRRYLNRIAGRLSFDAAVPFFSAAAYFLPGSRSAALAAVTHYSR